MPASTHAANTQPGDCSSAIMGATFLNTPDPIIELMVRMMAMGKPMLRSRDCCCSCIKGDFR